MNLLNVTEYLGWHRSMVAATAQEHGQEELPHVQGQGRRPRRATPRPGSGAAAERSYSMSKVRSRGCALLEWL